MIWATPDTTTILQSFLIPRTGFIGHWSGILCGLLLHCGVLPRNLAWSPEWTGVTHGSCSVSNIHGIDRPSWGTDYDNDDRNERPQFKWSALEYGKIIMAILLCICFIYFNTLGTIVLSQSITTIMFYFLSDIYKKSCTFHQNDIYKWSRL